MALTVSFPSDPVTNGIALSPLYMLTFQPADYAAVEYRTIQAFTSRQPGVKFDYLPVFKTGVASPEWSFMIRKDLAGASAPHRNFLGARVVTTTAQVVGFSPSLMKNISVPLQSLRVEVYNWFPKIFTMTDGTTLLRWDVATASVPFGINPETGAVLTDVGYARGSMEALGLLMAWQAAAGDPITTRAQALAAGMSPL